MLRFGKDKDRGAARDFGVGRFALGDGANRGGVVLKRAVYKQIGAKLLGDSSSLFDLFDVAAAA